MRKILVPLDGSDIAEQVLPYAESLARETGSTLYLVNVVTPNAGGAGTAMAAPPAAYAGAAGAEAAQWVREEQVEKAETYIHEMGSRLASRGLHVHPEVREGVAADEILFAAEEHDVDMIAISTHGRTGLGRTFFGSVADETLRESGRPVMVIKPVQE